MKAFILFIIAVLCFSSCATFYTGSNTIIHFSSGPQQAEISINDKVIGHTPQTIKIKRSIKKKNVEIKKDGYETEKFQLKRKFRTISLLSQLFIFVDVATGAMIDYPDNFIYTKLNSKSVDQKDMSTFNLSDNFYVVTTLDTIYTEPFQDFDYKSFFSSKLDKINFRLLNGVRKTIPVEDIVKYKTLEIYRKGIGYGLLSCQTKIDYNIKTYISALYHEGRKRSKYMFMEELLSNEAYHLVRSLTDVTQINAMTGAAEGNYNVPTFYLYEEGQVVKKIKPKELLNKIELYFSNEKGLIKLLKDKNKFKVLEKYVYGDKRRADRYYSPF